MYTYIARVVDIPDEDKVLATIDMGFSNFTIKKLKLYGIVANPDKLNELYEYMVSRLIPQEQLIINTYKDQDGNYSAEIFIDGLSFNKELVDKELVLSTI